MDIKAGRDTASPEQGLVEKDEKKRLQCSECSRVYRSTAALAFHMRKHLNSVQCVMCEYSTYNKTLLMEHVNGHLGIKPYQCGKCEYRSVSKKYMKIHESKHAACECGHVAKNVVKLTQHQLENGCRATPCESDVVTCSSRRKGEHQPDVTQPGSPAEDTPSSSSEDSMSCLQSVSGHYKCIPCKQQFTSRSQIRVHLNSHKPCPKCKIKMPPKLLKKHIKKQCAKNIDEKKKFKCKTCEFEANVLAKILLHLIHHPQDVDPTIDVTPLVNCGFLETNRSSIS